MLEQSAEDSGYLRHRKEVTDAVYSESRLKTRGETGKEKSFAPPRYLPGRDGHGREGELDEVGVPGVN